MLIFSVIVAGQVFKKLAFTLVELSIVLIIIGFIIAGISAAISLQKAFALQSVITEWNSFLSAYQNFKYRYGAVPGDMSNAFTYWGSTCGTNDSGLTTSCNGNGNGLVAFPGSGTTAPVEELKFWQHLTLSGMLPGSYTGTFASSFPGGREGAGVNIPATKYGNGGGYYVRTLNSADTYSVNYQRNALELGKVEPTWGVYFNGLVAPGDAYAIDVKADDGNGTTGVILAGRGNDVGANNVCMTAVVTAPTANFILTDTTQSCRMNFNLDNK